MTRNSHPATSVDPSDRANHPLMAIPTPARAKAAIERTIGATWRCDGVTAWAGRDVSVGACVTAGLVLARLGTNAFGCFKALEGGDSVSARATCLSLFALSVGLGAFGVGLGLFGLM
jgi:hypothetical protein